MTVTVPFGTSEPQDFALKDDGAAFDGTGMAVELSIVQRTATGTADVVDTPTVEWLAEAAGTVRVTGIEALAVGTYRIRFKVTGDEASVGYFPNSERPDILRIVAVP